MFPFLDLPGELRNAIYSHYLACLDQTTIYIVDGQILRPALPYTCRQVFAEFAHYWESGPQSKFHLIPQPQHIHVAIFDLDLNGWTKILERAKDIGWTDMFKSVRYVLVQLKPWDPLELEPLKYWGLGCFYEGEEEQWMYVCRERDYSVELFLKSEVRVALVPFAKKSVRRCPAHGDLFWQYVRDVASAVWSTCSRHRRF